MIDRRFLFICAVLLAFGLLAFFGLTPPVLWQKAQEFVSGATGAATTTHQQSRQREKRVGEVDTVLDGLPGEAEKKAERERRRRPETP